MQESFYFRRSSFHWKKVLSIKNYKNNYYNILMIGFVSSFSFSLFKLYLSLFSWIQEFHWSELMYPGDHRKFYTWQNKYLDTRQEFTHNTSTHNCVIYKSRFPEKIIFLGKISCFWRTFQTFNTLLKSDSHLPKKRFICFNESFLWLKNG